MVGGLVAGLSETAQQVQGDGGALRLGITRTQRLGMKVVFLDTGPASVVDQHGKMRPGSARTHEHGAPAVPTPPPSGSFDYAHEAGPATHRAIGCDQAHNKRTESWQPREQDLQSPLDNRAFAEAGQAQSSAERHRLLVSMRNSSESSKHKRK